MILVRYILREHLVPFAAALSVITFLFVIDYIINILDKVLSKGLPLGIVLELFVLNLAWMVALSVPMACLVSSLMAFGRMSADQEITALKAAGVRPLTAMRPVLLVGLLIMELLVVFNNWVLPEANHRASSLMQSISRKKPSAFVEAGKLIKQFPGVQIWIDRIDDRTGRLYGVQIYEFEGKKPPKIVFADSGFLNYEDFGATLMIYLSDGTNHMQDPEDPQKYLTIDFRKQAFAVKNVDDSFERREKSQHSDRELPVEDMLEVVKQARVKYEKITSDNADEMWNRFSEIIDLLERDSIVPAVGRVEGNWFEKPLRSAVFNKVIGEESRKFRKIRRVGRRLMGQKKRISQYWVEIHKKFSIPVACVVFILIGAPLGIMARKGGIGTGVVYSIFFFLSYWACLMGGENMADRLLIKPWVAMWTPNILIGFLGLLVTWRMTKDNFSGNTLWTRSKTLLSKRTKIAHKQDVRLLSEEKTV